MCTQGLSLVFALILLVVQLYTTELHGTVQHVVSENFSQIQYEKTWLTWFLVAVLIAVYSILWDPTVSDCPPGATVYWFVIFSLIVTTGTWPPPSNLGLLKSYTSALIRRKSYDPLTEVISWRTLMRRWWRGVSLHRTLRGRREFLRLINHDIRFKRWERCAILTVQSLDFYPRSWGVTHWKYQEFVCTNENSIAPRPYLVHIPLQWG